jgi:hypothetical protein
VIYRIRHLTQYECQQPVSLCYNLAQLQPRNTSYQNCLSSTVRIDPMPSYSRKRKGYYGNNMLHFPSRYHTRGSASRWSAKFASTNPAPAWS